MSSLPLWSYGGILVATLALSLVLTPMALRLALRLEVLDRPGPAKSHGEAMPYLGGAAIVVSFSAAVLVGTAVDPPPSGLPQLAAFLGLAVGLALVGLVDDVREGLSPWARVALEAGAGLAVSALGDGTHLAGFPGWLNTILTVVWVVGVTNAFNLLDNMDGLSAGVAAIAALAIFGVAWLHQRYLIAALAVALAGCAAGFLRHNFKPAKIYMGDAGSLFLGFVLAVLLLKLREHSIARVDMAVVLAIPGVALFDTALVTITRVAHRVSPFQGGQDHTSHRLVNLGFSVKQAVMTIYLAGAILGGGALAMSEFGAAVRIIGVISLLAAAGTAAVPLVRAPVRRAKAGAAQPEYAPGPGEGDDGAPHQPVAPARPAAMFAGPEDLA
jgi:UDP-GlcNAc:undecaprenyl-phosphate GlcNAc-1-phosphate transferase